MFFASLQGRCSLIDVPGRIGNCVECGSFCTRTLPVSDGRADYDNDRWNEAPWDMVELVCGSTAQFAVQEG